MATFSVGSMASMATSACSFQRERRLRVQRLRLVPPRASASSNNGPTNKLAMDRRDILLGLGGAAATVTSAMTPSGLILPATAAPVAPPDLSKCHTANSAPPTANKCCPPYATADVIDYDFPRTPLRVRRPAHEVKDDAEYMEKYKEAVRRMKEKVKSDHPWNFYQQALIHCAYCNDAYDQVGYSDPAVPLQVHYSWLFLPWHRYYLHFFERILGRLIEDDTFALPYWNFDVEEGMIIPEIFTSDKSSPLYNSNRDTSHYNETLDYKYAYRNTTGSGLTGKELVQANMSYMQTTFKNSLQLPELFMGDPLRAGETADGGAGGIESIHNSVHQWVGTADNDAHADMGNFATAARDCAFYSLHTNVDRLWHLYRNFRGNRVEFDEPDWLDASFIFYDEHERVVRVKLQDCLNPKKLCFTYEDAPIPWMGSLRVQKTKETRRKEDLKLVRVGEFGAKPRELGTTPLRVMVPRPKRNRNKQEKNEKVEMLQIKDIHITSHGPARFDVYVAAPYGDLAGPDFGEFAGSFVKLPHKIQAEEGNHGGPKHKGKKMGLKLGLTGLLEDIEAEDAEKLVVTIVPAGGDVTISGIQIKLVQSDVPKPFHV